MGKVWQSDEGRVLVGLLEDIEVLCGSLAVRTPCALQNDLGSQMQYVLDRPMMFHRLANSGSHGLNVGFHLDGCKAGS